MNRLHALAVLLFALALCTPLALAQTSTYILGVDTGTDGGFPPTRRVQVDSTGRLVLGPSGLVSTTPVACTASSVNSSTSVGVASVSTPAAALAARLYTLVCNSPQNAGVPLVKCRADGTSPVMAIGNPGEVLEVGDCVVYTLSAGTDIKCISDTAATYVTTFECK